MIDLIANNYVIPQNEDYVFYDSRIWHKNNHGYFKCIGIDQYDNAFGHLLHQWVYINNNGNIPINYVIHHIDENVLNNHPTNLLAVSHAQHNKIHFSNKHISKSRSDKLKISMKGKHNLSPGTSQSAKKGVITRIRNKLFNNSELYEYLSTLIKINSI